MYRKLKSAHEKVSLLSMKQVTNIDTVIKQNANTTNAIVNHVGINNYMEYNDNQINIKRKIYRIISGL